MRNSAPIEENSWRHRRLRSELKALQSDPPEGIQGKSRDGSSVFASMLSIQFQKFLSFNSVSSYATGSILLPLASHHHRSARQSVRGRRLLPFHANSTNLPNETSRRSIPDQDVSPQHFPTRRHRLRLHSSQLELGADHLQSSH